MASNLLKVLQNAEKARTQMIENANTVGIQATKSESLLSLSSRFLQINNRDVSLEYKGPHWIRPVEWPDTKSLLKNAPVRDGLHPAYIALFGEDCPLKTTIANKARSDIELQCQGVYTSDGQWYTDFTNPIEHVWDTSKDIDGYRYLIVYMRRLNNFRNTVTWGGLHCLELIVGALSGTGYFCSGYGNTYNSNNYFPYTYNYEHTADTHLTNIGNRFCNNMTRLQHVYVPHVTYLSSWSNMSPLYEFDAPDLEEAGGSSSPRVWTIKATVVNLPKFNKINTYGNEADIIIQSNTMQDLSLPSFVGNENAIIISGGLQLRNLDLPVLKQARSIITNGKIRELTTLHLPELVSTKGDLIYSSGVFPKLTTIDAPNLISTGYLCNTDYYNSDLGQEHHRTHLKNINIGEGCSYNANYLFCNNLDIKEYTFNPTHVLTGVVYMFGWCYSLSKINFYDNFKVNDLDFTYCRTLTHDSLVDMLNKLADVTSETNTYTLKLGSFNLGKLTAEEVAIGTNKGWTIS